MGLPGDVAASPPRSSLDSYFEGLVGVAEIKPFKPNADAYAHFMRQTGASGEEAWLLSGNPFDVIGAVSAGMNGAWARRSADAVFDPWEIAATVTVAAIDALVTALNS